MKWCGYFGKQSDSCSKIYHMIQQSYFYIYFISREKKTQVLTETCTSVFTAALFMIAKKWRKPKSLSPDECINKIWHIQTMEDYLIIKWSEALIRKTQMDLETSLLNERSQIQKTTYCIARLYLWELSKSMETESN